MLYKTPATPPPNATTIGLLIKPADSPLPVFDTTRLHAEAAVDYALAPD